jgi:copper chaperone NosL
MKRREFLGVLPLAVAAPYFSGCAGEPASGPVEIKWDRDTCARCSMVIGDRRFAAQIRDAQHKVWKFDDIGCAMFWLRQQAFDEATAKAEYWVADYDSGQWLAAPRANYVPGKKSPMGYHFAAFGQSPAGAVPYPEMKERVLALGK